MSLPIQKIDLTTLDLTDAKIAELYDQYLVDFKKERPASEKAERLEIFTKNIKTIAAHNADKSNTFVMGLNDFADMKESEKACRFGLLRN